MKFKLLSDLHLEFYNRYRGNMIKDVQEWEPEPTQEDMDTVLLLAGDIHVGYKALPWIKKMCKRFYHVVYILGNHEFYGHEYHKVRKLWRGEDVPNNFTFLDDDTLDIEDVRIIGGTLWTNVTDPHMIWQGPKRMTDYQVTKVNEYGHFRRMNVGDTNAAHYDTQRYIRKVLEMPWDGKTIVMTHHLPHPLCVQERFKGNELNAFFMTDLDDIIRNFNIDVWCHGHTHDNVDVEVHGTRILCNPMGYHGIQLNQEFDEGLTFEL